MATKKNHDTRRGAYHSRGIPGEEAEVRRLMRVIKLTDTNTVIPKSGPLKGGVTARSTSTGRLEDATEMPTVRSLHLLATKGTPTLQTPVFQAGDEGRHEGVMVFTDRSKALHYLQVAGWTDSHAPVPVSPPDLGVWLQEIRAEGIEFMIVDPDRKEHTDGKPQPALTLADLIDRSGENLYREIACKA